MYNPFSKIEKLSVLHDDLTPDVIKEKNVKLGLRNQDGTGVIVGITTKGRVEGYKKIPRDKTGKNYDIEQIPGKLFYCGYDVEKIIEGIEKSQRFGFEEVAYLLLTGELPIKNELQRFTHELSRRRSLNRAERRLILEEVANMNQMYALHSVISHMSRNDPRAASLDIKDITAQSINLIAKCPSIVANNYHVMRYSKGSDLKLVRAKPELSIAESFLHMLHGRMPDKLEAHIFDIAMILHAEHGGGNNSTFTVRCVSSSGSSTYMAIAAGIASLSGHLHGGANESVTKMMKSLMKRVKNWDSRKEIGTYIKKILDKRAGDRSGKIFGFGHAVYTISDPRAVILKKYARELAERKNALDEFALYELVDEVASSILEERYNKVMCANVDFYSGFIYKMMGIPRDLFTPIFAMSRVVGWCAHRIEQIIQGKIMRPAYISLTAEEIEYIDIKRR